MNVPARSTNAMAVVSLASGIGAWIILPVLLALVAVICGHAARSQIRRDADQDGDGMALGGLILGYANLALALLVVMGLVLFFAVLAQNWH